MHTLHDRNQVQELYAIEPASVETIQSTVGLLYFLIQHIHTCQLQLTCFQARESQEWKATEAYSFRKRQMPSVVSMKSRLSVASLMTQQTEDQSVELCPLFKVTN